MISETNIILRELKEIKTDIKMIKESMPDKELFLTVEEELLLEKSFINEKKKKLISSKDLKEELGL